MGWSHGKGKRWFVGITRRPVRTARLFLSVKELNGRCERLFQDHYLMLKQLARDSRSDDHKVDGQHFTIFCFQTTASTCLKMLRVDGESTLPHKSTSPAFSPSKPMVASLLTLDFSFTLSSAFLRLASDCTSSTSARS